jgi:hypothetical protein
MLLAIRDLQIPLLAAMLLGGCAAKAFRVVRTRSLAAALGPTGLFPWRLRRPVMIAMCAMEFGLGIALIATAIPGTAGSAGAGTSPAGPSPAELPGTLARAMTALFFLVAVGTLYEVRQRRPEAGCGCFGDLSDTPIGLRTIARAAMLCVAAVAAVGAPPLRMPATSAQAGILLGVLTIELALLAALSPEVAEVLVRLGYSEPCELRRLPVARTLTALRASSQWRRYAGQLASVTPTDVWREGCWRFLVFPGRAAGQPVDVVYAVYLQARRPPIRVAVLDEVTDELPPPPSPLESAAL